jgi:hypothetical protein
MLCVLLKEVVVYSFDLGFFGQQTDLAVECVKGRCGFVDQGSGEIGEVNRH